MIISFVQTKGGTGKSTLALNTAFSNHMNSAYGSVALVELDPQGTLRSWWDERSELGRDSGRVSFHHISSTQKEVFADGIRSIAAHNDLIIMDIPGESTGKLHTRFACAVSDLVIIPMRTSTNDEAAFADNLYPIIKEIIKIDPAKKRCFHVLPSFTHPKANIDTIVGYFTDILPPLVGCLRAIYPDRSVYENFNRDGTTLEEYAHSVRDNKRNLKQAVSAAGDVERIAETITQMLEKKHVTAQKEKKAL
ncbi:MAG TPA: ParA family protein [Deltaproteobacteria bacterium]|nr:ParA family protein [Deltaproteobacteria bacterium]HPR54996.1 ParA family protein [Deltaproteobacteria bacterium]HXK46333.1 ParA family protein [Deltaproteobacteria bacterium]